MPIWSSAIAPAAPMRRLRKRSGSSRSQGTTTSTTRVTSVSAWSTAAGSWWAYHAVHGGSGWVSKWNSSADAARQVGSPLRSLVAPERNIELEQQEHQQHAGRAPAGSARARPRRQVGRRPQHRQQPGLQQQRVPLKGEEVLSRHGEREVQRPEQEEHRHRGHAEHEKDWTARRRPRPRCGALHRSRQARRPSAAGATLRRRRSSRPSRGTGRPA